MNRNKSKNSEKSLSKLITYCKKYIPVIIIALTSAVIGTILTIIGPDKLSEMTDIITAGIMTSIDLDKIASIGLTLVAIYVISAILTFAQGYIMATITQKVSKNLRSDISKKINKLPMSYYNNNTTGDLLSRVTNDVDTIGQALNQSVGTLISAICLFFGSLIMMLKTNVIMTVTAVLATMIGFALMMIIMKSSQKYFMRQQEYLGKINGHVEEVYSGHTIVKAYNAEEQMDNKFRALNSTLKNSTFKAQFLSGLMMPIMTFIGNLGYVAVCVVGASLAMNGNISFGVIVAFIMYVRYFTQPLAQMAQGVQNLQSAAAASHRVFEFLEAKEMEDESHKTKSLENAKGKVEFKNVKFGYEGSDRIIINDFSAIAKPGQKVAIVGPTGAGKSTLVNLLMRFNEINSGEILIDDIPTSDLTRENIHDLFCMVLQDTWLFEGTIAENIAYGKMDATREEIIAAAKAACCDHFIRTLEHGYDTVISSETANISQGQMQLLTIARAMLTNPTIMILDEATSSVDTRTEIEIQKALSRLMKDKTSFVIAHRLSTIQNADMILVVKDGDIVERGTHKTLLEQNGFYASLYYSQFEVAN